MTREELVHRVKVKLEELSPYGYEAPLIAIQEDSEITENINKEIKPIISYISECLEESCNAILMALPLHLINYKEVSYESYIKSSFVIKLPQDFLRLHTANCKDWSRVVTSAITEENPMALYEANIHTMGKPTRPVVLIRRNGLSREALLNTSTNKDFFDYFRYVAKFDDTNIQDSLADFFALQCAIDVCSVLKIDSNQISDELSRLIKLNNY
jgi:hypothetical protein